MKIPATYEARHRRKLEIYRIQASLEERKRGYNAELEAIREANRAASALAPPAERGVNTTTVKAKTPKLPTVTPPDTPNYRAWAALRKGT